MKSFKISKTKLQEMIISLLDSECDSDDELQEFKTCTYWEFNTVYDWNEYGNDSLHIKYISEEN